ncbi:LysR family transcriptional regulator [Luteipulveratus mongoliensis]|uniref:LysR family transcriptional regulator n=1 Tax=Luteipulveratus mongoliensis TaxID=571913 RepID=UPI0009F8E48E|nr:LysR family transcriptional regulator [Luteipulveratus mongoliensis]
MDLVALRTFVEVCRLGSISAAAVALGYSQSAVSRQVAGLEQRLGHALLDRRPRGVRPTVHGEALLTHARIIVREVDRAEESVRTAGVRPRCRLAVGGVPSATASLVPRTMTRFAEVQPDVGVSVSGDLTSVLLARVESEELDLAVVTDFPPGLPDAPGIELRHLMDDEMHLAVGLHHRLASSSPRRVRLESLADESWVEDNAGSATVLVQAAARAGFSPRIEYDVRGLLSKLALVASGHGVAVVPGLLLSGLRSDIATRRLLDPPRRGVYVAHRRTAMDDPVIGAFVEALTAEVADVSPRPRRAAGPDDPRALLGSAGR